MVLKLHMGYKTSHFGRNWGAIWNPKHVKKFIVNDWGEVREVCLPPTPKSPSDPFPHETPPLWNDWGTTKNCTWPLHFSKYHVENLYYLHFQFCWKRTVAIATRLQGISHWQLAYNPLAMIALGLGSIGGMYKVRQFDHWCFITKSSKHSSQLKDSSMFHWQKKRR